MTTTATPTSVATTSTTVKLASGHAAVKAPAATRMASSASRRAGWGILFAGGVVGLGMFGFLAWHGSVTQANSNPAAIVNTAPGGIESNSVGGSTS